MEILITVAVLFVLMFLFLPMLDRRWFKNSSTGKEVLKAEYSAMQEMISETRTLLFDFAIRYKCWDKEVVLGTTFRMQIEILYELQYEMSNDFLKTILKYCIRRELSDRVVQVRSIHDSRKPVRNKLLEAKESSRNVDKTLANLRNMHNTISKSWVLNILCALAKQDDSIKT
jgi:hypothetical protein